MKKNDYGKKKFKRFAREKRLRLKKDDDGLPIVVARGKEWAGCHLFEGFGTKEVGLFIKRNTKFKLSHIYGALCREGFTPIARGDTECIFRIPYGLKGRTLMKIARRYKMIKRLHKLEVTE
jgi:hypothetical protein